MMLGHIWPCLAVYTRSTGPGTFVFAGIDLFYNGTAMRKATVRSPYCLFSEQDLTPSLQEGCWVQLMNAIPAEAQQEVLGDVAYPESPLPSFTILYPSGAPSLLVPDAVRNSQLVYEISQTLRGFEERL